MLKAFTLFVFLSLPSFAFAQMVENQTELSRNLVGTAVVLRTLDKVTATTQDYTVKIGESLQYGSLSIDVKHCEKKPPEDIPETYAFLQIKDTRLNGIGENADNDLTVFSGWMFASKPAISALDHRVYDVWVIDCEVPIVVSNEPDSLQLDELRR